MRDGGVVTAATDTTAVDKGLRTGTLGLFGSVVMGISSTAPAYSLAASLGLVVASGGALLAGVKAPAIMLLAFIPMWMIAVAYQELNKEDPDCGTTFTWATRAFGAVTGGSAAGASSPRTSSSWRTSRRSPARTGTPSSG